MKREEYQCPICSKKAKTQEEIICHYESEHPTLRGSFLMIPESKSK